MKRIMFVLSMILALSAIAAPGDKENTRTVPRYVCGVLDGSFTFQQWGSNWWEIYSIGEATGTLRHLGAAEMHTKHTPTLSGDLVDGTFTIVAANGDELRGTYSGTATEVPGKPFHYVGKATLVISGGTGRFNNAEGQIDATFFEILDSFTFESAEVTWTLSGMVSY